MMPTASRPNLALWITAFLLLAMAVAGPVAQPAHYHAFADQRVLCGIPHAANVLSNAGFLIVGLYGFARRPPGPAYAIFFMALVATAFGSAWYHLAPEDMRLVWDRLPIALACAALVAGVLADAIAERVPPAVVLAILLTLAALSVGWWHFTQDLRPYLAVQLAPLLLAPAIQWQAHRPVAERKAFGVAIVLYVLAKLCELADSQLYAVFGYVSGHTLKHLLATAAALALTMGIVRRASD
jgi:hypothetical protein